VNTISDDDLIEELKKRLDNTKKALYDLRVVNKKLTSVNEKLAESEALKSNFLSNIRNEINNPLTSIMGISRQIAGGNIDRETTHRVAQLIHNEAFDLDFQLRNIFSAAELEAGEATRSISKVNMDTFVCGLIDSFSHRAAAKNARIEVVWDAPRETEDTFYFRTDPEKLERVLANLLANAIEFNDKGKRVKISIGKEENRLNISVEDEGIGIPEEQRKNLFARFKQLDSGSRKAHHGHGLGLSITKALVEVLDGKITFASAPGGGSIFTVSINEAGTEMGAETHSEEGNEFIF
jgi:signal transduction histidine kinase